MQIITGTYLEKQKRAWSETTMDGDPNANNVKTYFEKMLLLTEEFDVVQVCDEPNVSGEFSINSNMAMMTDGSVMYSADGIDPINHVEYSIAHIKNANYIITIDEASCLGNDQIKVSYSQLFVKSDKLWIREHIDLLRGRLQNLESEWAKRED